MKTWEDLEAEIRTWGANRWPVTLEAAFAIRACHEPGMSMIETGTFRGCEGDGMSTYLFGMLAQMLGTSLISVDVNQVHIDKSIELASQHPHISVIHTCQDSVAFLSSYTGKISFLYLDSYDYLYDNVLPCQIHNLAEAGAAIGKMAKRSVILCDDSDLPEGGKPKLTVEWLVSRGWKVVKKEYQVLLTNFDYDHT